MGKRGHQSYFNCDICNDVMIMNYEHMYTKNINRHLIHILDRNNRRQGVFGNNLMNKGLYICMNLLMNLCDFF